MMKRFYLAELNMARALYPLEDPRMAEFVANLDAINGLAERSPGFIWRLVNINGSTTTVRLFDDPLLLVNLSVWETVDALFDYVYRSQHLEFWKRRHEWFSHDERSGTVMWWIPADQLPTLEEAVVRLEQLQRIGPTVEAFTFKQRFAVPQL